MAEEQRRLLNVSDIPVMRELVEDVFLTGQPRILRVDDTGAEVEVRPRAVARRRRRKARRTLADSFLASYQAIPPLGRTLSVEEMTEIAAEEHAQEAASKGL